MGSFILKGITTALLVTVLTLFAGIIWSAIGFGGLSVSLLLDIGLLASCLVGGYLTAKESGVWFMGGVTGAGFVTVGTLLLALFLPIQGWGFIRVLGEGALLGLVAGVFGAGKKSVIKGWSAKSSQFNYTPSFVGYKNDPVSSEFDWGTEDKSRNDWDTENESTFDWGTDDESKNDWAESLGTKKSCNEGSKIEWPWDREAKKKKLEAAKKESRIFETWEPEPFDSDFGDWGIGREDDSSKKKSRSEKRKSGVICSEKSTKPWWEE